MTTATTLFDEVAGRLIANRRERQECREKLERLYVIGGEA
jgi:hypothetical protein